MPQNGEKTTTGRQKRRANTNGGVDRVKNLYLIGGTMGVGKTTVCRHLKESMENSVFLDGDWCWDAHPFQVTDETKQMVLRNICFLLNSFLHCSAYENIIFCWVMHEQGIIDSILANLDAAACAVYNISLVCSGQTLESRLKNDVARGIRQQDVIERSIARLPLYEKLHTVKIDTDGKSAAAVAAEIRGLKRRH